MKKNFGEILDFVRKLKVSNPQISLDNVVKKLAEEKVYHSLAIEATQMVFDADKVTVAETFYRNSYYSAFKNESNPFLDDFFETVNED